MTIGLILKVAIILRRPSSLERKVKGIKQVEKHCSVEKENKDCLLSEGKMPKHTE